MLQEHPQSAVYHYLRGEVSEDTEERLRFFRKAIELDSTYVWGYYGLAVTLAGCGQTAQAISYYQKLLELDPANPIGYQGLGSVYGRLGENDRQIEIYKRMIAHLPDDAYGYLGLAAIYGRTYRLEEAAEVYRAAYERFKGDSWNASRALYGYANLLEDKAEKARLFYRLVEKYPTAPNVAQAYRELFDHYREVDPEYGLKLARSALTKPESPGEIRLKYYAYRSLFDHAVRARNEEEARKLVDEIVDSGYPHPRLYQHLGNHCQRTDPQLAIELFRKSLEFLQDDRVRGRFPGKETRDISTSRFYYQAPRKTRYEDVVGGPLETVTVTNGKRITTYFASLNQYRVTTLPERRSSFRDRMRSTVPARPGVLVERMLLSSDPARELLEQAEDLLELGPQDVGDARLIVVTFKLPAASLIGYFGKQPDGSVEVELGIDEAEFLIRRVSLRQAPPAAPEQDSHSLVPVPERSVVIHYEDIELNPKLKRATFEFRPPDGAKLVDRFEPPDRHDPRSVSLDLVGEQVPVCVLHDLEGQEVRLEDWKEKVLIIEFWATWCGPCRAQIPVYTALQSLYGDRGLTIIALSVDEDSKVVQEFVEREILNFPVLMADHQVKQDFGGISVLPTTFIVDRKGIIRQTFRGSPPDKLLLQKYLEEILAEKPVSTR